MIKGLTTEQKQFIDDHFYEGLHESDIDRRNFDLLSTPYEFHYIAENHNWDDGVTLLLWIANSEICSEATALLLFWESCSQDFQVYKLSEELKSDYQTNDNQTFNLIKTIYHNFQNDFYKKSDIDFDPTGYLKNERGIPHFMKKATNGEEPYIYFEEKEVNSWFGEIVETKINRCETAMELYNIASFVKYNRDNRVEFILKHPQCDKAVAMMIFWRLKTYSALWYSEHTVLDEIIEKIKNNEYREEIYYNPNKDKDIKMKEPKAKWVIPNSMKQKINSVSDI